MIIMDGICKDYKMGNQKIKALDEVSIYVEKGSFCSIVGTSGSGKSTLLNIIGCLDVATRGSYFLDNQEIIKDNLKNMATVRNQKLGFVFQNFNLIKGLSAVENVEIPLIIDGTVPKKRRELALAALDMVGLSQRAKHKFFELSGGQQQRVAIARAIIKNPPLLLADEPTGNLDEPSGKEIMEIFKRLNKGGTTILMITHDMNKAKITDKTIKIKEGKIVR